VSTVRSEADEVGRQAEKRSDDEAAQPPSNPVRLTIFFNNLRAFRGQPKSVGAHAVPNFDGQPKQLKLILIRT
jgi:hypothetical protein